MPLFLQLHDSDIFEQAQLPLVFLDNLIADCAECFRRGCVLPDACIRAEDASPTSQDRFICRLGCFQLLYIFLCKLFVKTCPVLPDQKSQRMMSPRFVPA